MQPEALEKLAKNSPNEFEAAWMKLVESADLTPERWAGYEPALRALVKRDRQAQAETLAWAAIESIAGGREPIETIKMAGPLLRGVGESDELRAQVTSLYTSAYEGREGLKELIEEAGLPSGRPVRRALRTLEVALNVSEGDYLIERHDEGAARVESIDPSTWTFKITNEDGTEKLDAVKLADRYRMSEPENFRVLMRFFPDRLLERVNEDPASIVVDLCRENGNTIGSDQLMAYLVPDVLDDDAWKKWWTKARSALKKLPNVQIDGRSPYYITYTESKVDFGAQLEDAFVKIEDPVKQVALVEEYVRDCQARGDAPDATSVTKCCQVLAQRASAVEGSRPSDAFVHWLAERRIGELTGVDAHQDRAEAMIRDAQDLTGLIAEVPDASLQQLACALVIEHRPDDWQPMLLDLLPKVAMPVCDWCAKRLMASGVDAAKIVELVQPIIASPVENFEALLWLWNAPDVKGIDQAVPPVSVLFAILRGLEASRLEDHIDRSVAVRLGARARSVLGARKCERFVACVGTLEPGMAQALRRQLHVTDNLGRSVREDMLRILDGSFPRVTEAPVLRPWEREETLYVTEPGLARKQEEVNHHVNVKMRENAKAIGEAAEKGDLSENSEYKFALEERDLLRARLAHMNTELAQARVLRPDDVPEEEIGVGTRAVFRKVSDGSTYEITFFGPWEADFDQGILNYRSPLGMELMGVRVGEQVVFDHRNASGTYELVSVSNALVEASNV